MAGKGGFAPRVLGAACSLLVGSVFILGVVEVGLNLSGIVGTGHGVVEAASRRLEIGEEDEWEDNSSKENNWVLIDLMVRLIVMVLVCICECLALFCHWNLFIKPTPTKYIPPRAIVPQDLKGDFKYGLFDCSGDCGTCCCFVWCSPCMLADLWFRSGWLHAALGSTADGSEGGTCPGWPFFAGVGGFCVAQDSVGCCMPCVYAVLRGGIGFADGSDGGLGEIVPHRKRFEMPHDGFSTFINDTCIWCWCGSCAGTQEYRQVMALLDRGPVQQSAPVHGQVVASVVGAPVQTAQVVQVGQPVPAAVVQTNKAEPAV